SGGKDSVALAFALWRLRSYYEHPFHLHALTLDPCFYGKETGYSPIEDFFGEVGIPYTVIRSNIGRVVFETRREKNPCALCAKMRRGALHTAAKELGCNKIALGHHLDDAIETFFMNLLGQGRINCFSPVTWLSRKQITLIRPFVLAEEKEVARAVREEHLPIVKNPCPVDGETARQQMKSFVMMRAEQDRSFRQKMLGALQKADIDGWMPKK
ncbi:tRNA 2-thiocytidine biosynthesis TtcA family protein, partial [Ruminococcaceae bacterium OttesenSCG-928-I18]|nr:tRNA 2-thiocytidine biosynthesis TtcA family protein [Ruminococcaceae bacterium OttesenSCG-928-I18]